MRDRESDIHTADPGARRAAVIVLACAAVAGFAVLTLVESYRDDTVAWITGDPVKAIGRLRVVLAVFYAVVALPVLLLSRYLVRLAKRTVAACRFPPPDLVVFRDTRVLRGTDSLWLARVLRLSAGLLLALLLMLAVLLWRLPGALLGG